MNVYFQIPVHLEKNSSYSVYSKCLGWWVLNKPGVIIRITSEIINIDFWKPPLKFLLIKSGMMYKNFCL